MRKLTLALGFCVFCLDLASKWWVVSSPSLQDYSLIEGFFRIRYVRNEGIAFGLFHTLQSGWKPVILSLLAVVALSVVLYYIRVAPSANFWTLFPLGLLLGGILGNFAERLYHQHVTDFLELHWRGRVSWPTFNIADAAITCGVLWLLYQTLFYKEPEAGQQERLAGHDEV